MDETALPAARLRALKVLRRAKLVPSREGARIIATLYHGRQPETR